MKPLKELYNLPYDSSGFNSGLINWYNKVIDKTYEDLTLADVCKMIRQNIVKNVAIKKAIELFLCNPYDGEHIDGDLLATLTSLDTKLFDVHYNRELKYVLEDVKQGYNDFDWSDEKTKIQYAKNIEKMLKNIESGAKFY